MDLSRKCAIKVTLEYSIWTYHENILITNIKVNGPGNKIKSINID